MCDEITIKDLLEANGFSNITILQSGETIIADVETLNLFKRNGSSMYVEARKI
jgi:hypothetical protein